MHKQAIVTVIFLLAVSAGVTAHASETRVYASNYDVRLSVAGSVAHVTSRSRVRDGSAIPIDFQDHRIELGIAAGKNQTVVVTVRIFERSQAEYRPLLPEPLVFDANLTTPTEFGWQAGDVSLSVAIAISEHGH